MDDDGNTEKTGDARHTDNEKRPEVVLAVPFEIFGGQDGFEPARASLRQRCSATPAEPVFRIDLCLTARALCHGPCLPGPDGHRLFNHTGIDVAQIFSTGQSMIGEKRCGRRETVPPGCESGTAGFLCRPSESARGTFGQDAGNRSILPSFPLITFFSRSESSSIL